MAEKRAGANVKKRIIVSIDPPSQNSGLVSSFIFAAKMLAMIDSTDVAIVFVQVAILINSIQSCNNSLSPFFELIFKMLLLLQFVREAS